MKAGHAQSNVWAKRLHIFGIFQCHGILRRNERLARDIYDRCRRSENMIKDTISKWFVDSHAGIDGSSPGSSEPHLLDCAGLCLRPPR